jgi:hypothetical protein
LWYNNFALLREGETKMSEQEMLQEIERLRRELADEYRGCDSFRGSACHMVPIGRAPLSEEELVEMSRDGLSIDLLLRRGGTADQSGPPENTEEPADRGLNAQIDALRADLAQASKERKWLHKLVCRMLAMDDPDVFEAEFLEMLKQPMYGIEDIIEDLLKDEPGSLPPQKQIPA